MGCSFLHQGIFPTQRSNLCLLCLQDCRQTLYPLSHAITPQNSRCLQQTVSLAIQKFHLLKSLKKIKSNQYLPALSSIPWKILKYMMSLVMRGVGIILIVVIKMSSIEMIYFLLQIRIDSRISPEQYHFLCVHAKSLQSCPTLAIPWIVAC